MGCENLDDKNLPLKSSRPDDSPSYRFSSKHKTKKVPRHSTAFYDPEIAWQGGRGSDNRSKTEKKKFTAEQNCKGTKEVCELQRGSVMISKYNTRWNVNKPYSLHHPLQTQRCHLFGKFRSQVGGTIYIWSEKLKCMVNKNLHFS